MKVELRLSGFGGQGVITAGFIIGKAALFDKKSAVMTQSYGPESRGARVSSDVIISDEPIDYPKVTDPEVSVFLSQEAYNVYGIHIHHGTIIFDEELVAIKAEEHRGAQIYKIFANRLAEELGNRVVTNIVMLGFLTAVTNLVSPQAMERAITDTVPKKAKELNQAAFQRGYECGLRAVKESTCNLQKRSVPESTSATAARTSPA
jgi:2-oxoglutarate ferredoxin oxidoreductase subunit gamma